MHRLLCVHYRASRDLSCPQEKRGDIINLCSQGMCLLTPLIAAKGSGIAQFRCQRREKAVSLPKISINIFDFSKVDGRRGLEKNVQLKFLVGKIDM